MIDILENSDWDNHNVPTLANIRKGDHYTLYIGRENLHRNLEGSKWGNPFHLKNESERNFVLRQHADWLEDQEDLIAALPELSGHTLGCWCCSGFINPSTSEFHGTGKPCHGWNLIKAYLKYVKK